MTIPNIKIHKVIVDFLQSLDPEIEVGYEDSFCYYRGTNEVCYTFEEEDVSVFLTDLRNRCSFVDEVSIFVWAVLHEVGHHFTLDQLIEDDVYNPFATAIIKIIDDPKLHPFYYLLVEEKAATQWAIDFIQNNPELVEKFMNDLDIASK